MNGNAKTSNDEDVETDVSDTKCLEHIVQDNSFGSSEMNSFRTRVQPITTQNLHIEDTVNVNEFRLGEEHQSHERQANRIQLFSHMTFAVCC